MNESTLIAKSSRSEPPATWIAVLECVESAEPGVLNLDGGAPQVVSLAERLVDLGFLCVHRAGCYSLTPAGKQLLVRSTTGLAASKSPGRIALFLTLSLVTLALAVL